MNPLLSHVDVVDVVNSGRFGGLDNVSYARIVEQLGEPNVQDDPTKVDASWAVQHEDGRVLCVWNYKNGQAYLGKDGVPVEDILFWSYGGDKSLANELFGA